MTCPDERKSRPEVLADAMANLKRAVRERDALAFETLALRQKLAEIEKGALAIADPASAPPISETASEALSRVQAQLRAYIDRVTSQRGLAPSSPPDVFAATMEAYADAVEEREALSIELRRAAALVRDLDTVARAAIAVLHDAGHQAFGHRPVLKRASAFLEEWEGGS
ncbi:MAG: hypothetical protein AAGM38_15865 [Pseudomonadota bacterium]